MKFIIILLLTILTASCASKNQLSGVAGPFKNEGEVGLFLYVNTVENDGDSLDLKFTIKNNYPFAVQIPPNVLSITFNGQHSTRTLQSHSSWLLQPNESASSLMVYEFEPSIPSNGKLKVTLAGATRAEDIQYSNTKGSANTVGIGHVYSKHGSKTGVGVSNTKIETSTVDVKAGAQLQPISGTIDI